MGLAENLGFVGAYEVLCRTVGSGLPYISVVDSWPTRDGAWALAWQFMDREYGEFELTTDVGNSVITARRFPEFYEEQGEWVAAAWVWYNVDAEEEG